MGEDFPKHIQDIRRDVLIPAMQKIKKEKPHDRPSVIGNRLIVNGKRFFFNYDIPKEWLPTKSKNSTASVADTINEQLSERESDKCEGTDQDLFSSHYISSVLLSIKY